VGARAGTPADQGRLQKTVEELEAAHEEFKATGEEMQSTNEELQSTNEELKTAKEELQSLNEELQTVNTELERKVDTLSEVHDDMDQSVEQHRDCCDLPDNDLHIKRFTAGDPGGQSDCADIGRPLSDIVVNLEYDSLEDDAQEILQDAGVPQEREVYTKTGTGIHTDEALSYCPERDQRPGDHVVDVPQLITMPNCVPGSWWLRREYCPNHAGGRRWCLMQSCAWCRRIGRLRGLTNESPSTVEQRYIYELGNGQWNSARLRELWRTFLPHNWRVSGL
jgi:hypothetical protein